MRPIRTTVGARLSNSPPFVTVTLIALNVLVYLAGALTAGGTITDPTRSRIFGDWALWPVGVYHYDEYYRLVTAAFEHLSLIHIGANMLALYFVGPALERVLGRSRFLALYLLSALGGSVAVYAIGDANVLVVGASGAIFGLFAACLVMVRKLGLDPQWLIGIIVLNFVFTFSIAGISKLGHIGGFITGAVVALAIAGLPQSSRHLRPRVQAAGLASVTLLLILLIGLRTTMGVS